MESPIPSRVLIVDDEPHIRAYLRIILKEWGVQDIREAGDGANAEIMFHHQEPELVLLDVNLPGDDGTVVLSKLLERDPSARVVMITAVATREIVEKCAAAGASNFIRKDTPRDQILAVLLATWADATSAAE